MAAQARHDPPGADIDESEQAVDAADDERPVRTEGRGMGRGTRRRRAWDTHDAARQRRDVDQAHRAVGLLHKAYERHSPPRLGNARKPRHPRASVLQPPKFSSVRPRAPPRLVWRRISRLPSAYRQPDPTIDLYPGKRNDSFTLDRPITDEKINGNYNNFYEFNSSKM